MGKPWENHRKTIGKPQENAGLLCGKHTKNYGTSQFLMGKSTISMAIFNSELLVYKVTPIQAMFELLDLSPQIPPMKRASLALAPKIMLKSS